MNAFNVLKIGLRVKMGFSYYPVITDYPAIFSKTCVQHDRIIEEVLYLFYNFYNFCGCGQAN